MNRLIYIVPLAIAIALTSLVSCRRVDKKQVQNVISAADSLLDTNPYAALDTLLSPDSVTVAGLHGKLRADYALLLAEAEYKCYSPLSDNEKDILRAVDWFRKHGPEEKHAGALMMKGAMLYEKGDAEAALQAYKTAEPILESIGDLERLGLLHTRIGEVYLHSVVNGQMAAERFRKALDCFEKAGLPQRVMSTHLTLASSLPSDSLESVLSHTMAAITIVEQEDNRLYGIAAWMQYINTLHSQGLYQEVVSKTHDLFSTYGYVPTDKNEYGIYNIILVSAKTF